MRCSFSLLLDPPICSHCSPFSGEHPRITRRECPSKQERGPFKPSVGLSGVVPPAYIISQLPVRVLRRSTPIQSPPVLRSRSRSGESCSTPNLQGARTTRPLPDCDEHSEAFARTAPHFGY